MNTEEEFNLKKANAVALFIQMFLVVIGLLISVNNLYLDLKPAIRGDLPDAWFWLPSDIAVLLAFVSLLIYATYGYKKTPAYFWGAVYALSGVEFFYAVVIVCVHDATVLEIICCMLSFGMIMAFGQRPDNKRFGCMTLGIVCICTVVTAVRQTVLYLSLGRTFGLWLISPWVVPILAGTVEMIYLTRWHRGDALLMDVYSKDNGTKQ